jgi:hypothetical protein
LGARARPPEAGHLVTTLGLYFYTTNQSQFKIYLINLGNKKIWFSANVSRLLPRTIISETSAEGGLIGLYLHSVGNRYTHTSSTNVRVIHLYLFAKGVELVINFENRFRKTRATKYKTAYSARDSGYKFEIGFFPKTQIPKMFYHQTIFKELKLSFRFNLIEAVNYFFSLKWLPNGQCKYRPNVGFRILTQNGY